MLAFFGLPYDENMTNSHEDELTRENAAKIKIWNNLSRGVMSNTSRKYLKELREEEIKAIEKICYFEMKCLGYKTEYSKSELDAFSDEQIEALAKKEKQEIICKRSSGGIANMETKKIFHQMILS